MPAPAPRRSRRAALVASLAFALLAAPRPALQRPLDAPNSISVITADEIRLSGLTRVQAILRRLAGVDAMMLNGGRLS